MPQFLIQAKFFAVEGSLHVFFQCLYATLYHSLTSECSVKG